MAPGPLLACASLLQDTTPHVAEKVDVSAVSFTFTGGAMSFPTILDLHVPLIE